MDGQFPNFDAFLKPSTFVKPTNRSNNPSSNKKQNKPQSSSNYTNHNNFGSLVHELPETQFPTTQHPVLFYKMKERLTSEMFTVRIGYKVREFSRVEEDYICYLTQLLMTECNWLKIFIIEPNYLYFEINSISTEQEASSNCNQNQKQQNVLQNKIFNFLKHLSQSVFSPWIQTHLAPQRLTSAEFDEGIFIEQFQQQVIQKAKQIYDSTFNNQKKSQNKK